MEQLKEKKKRLEAQFGLDLKCLNVYLRIRAEGQSMMSIITEYSC